MSETIHGADCQCQWCKGQERLREYYGDSPSRVRGDIVLWRGAPGVVLAIIVVVLLYFLFRWAYAEYYIATHCTEVLGTRVCQ